jgi:hypothetical protein
VLPHVTPGEWILSGLIVGCVLACALAELHPRKRDDDEPPDSSDDDDLTLAT